MRNFFKGILSITFLSKALIITGLIIIFKEYFCGSQDISDARLYLIMSVFSGGVILLLGSDLLLKFYNKSIDKILYSEDLEKKIRDRINESMDDYDKTRSQEDKEIEEIEDNGRVSNELDTLTVPCAQTINYWIKILNDTYFCPQNRPHKKTEYLALYYDKKIMDFGKYTVKTGEEVFSNLKLNSLKNNFENEFGSINKLTFYQFDSEPIKLEIVHDKPYAFVRRHRYLSSANLISNKGKSTDDLTIKF